MIVDTEHLIYICRQLAELLLFTLEASSSRRRLGNNFPLINDKNKGQMRCNNKS